MKLMRNSKLLLLSGMLAVGSLALAATATPPAHAACTTRSIYASGQGGGVKVYGSCFPTGTNNVRLVLLNDTLTQDLGITHVSADASGNFATLLSTSYVGYVRVAADASPDVGPDGSLLTAWSRTYVYPAPHLVGWETTSYIGKYLDVEGSGFYPGGVVEIDVWNSNGSQELGSQRVSTTASGIDAGIVDATFSFNYSGNVQVYAWQVWPSVVWANSVQVYY